MTADDQAYWGERGERERRAETQAEAFGEAKATALAILTEEIARRSEGRPGTGYARQALKTARSRIEREVNQA